MLFWGICVVYLVDNVCRYSNTRYVIISGVATVKAFSVPAAVFTSGGTLTLGQFTPGLSASIAVGDFIGYIDEVRIWSRPHNPTVTSNNFRLVITDDTSDVFHNWNFNEGIDLTAYNDRGSQNMVVINSLAPPEWVKSNINLAEDKNLDVPRLSPEDELSAATVLAAQEICISLISDFSLSLTGSTVAVLTEVYEAICGANCSFGNVQNETCVCFDSHWGTTCEYVCPIAVNGACSSFGVCDADAGICNCHPRHYTNTNTVVDFWTGYLSSSNMSMSSAYACGECSADWVGEDCQFAKSSKSNYAGIVYGSYISTFDGVSFTHSTPGIYTLIKSGSLNVQALFLPCAGTNTCRYLKELAIRSNTATVMIQHNFDTNVTFTLQDEEIQYPSSKTLDGIEIEWTQDPFIKIAIGSSEMVIYDSNIGLTMSANIQSDVARDNQGLLGSADGLWTNDIQCEDETNTLNENQISGTYAGDCIRSRYMPNSADIIIKHEYGSETLSSGGYALSLSAGQTFSVNGFDIEENLSSFTISFWVKTEITSKKRSVVTYELLSSNIGSETLVFEVKAGNLQFTWGTTHETTLSFNTGVWYYISFSWQSSDGVVDIYLVTEFTTESFKISNVKLGATADVEDITVTSTSAAKITIDCIRLWTETKTDQEVQEEKDTYCGPVASDSTLMFSMLFDEGDGITSTMTTFSTNSGSTSGTVTGTVFGTISGDSLIENLIDVFI